ncbi:MAG: Holliday junction branch migration protein RuvA [Actinomycetales bacterium]|nr:Holliday junction branch migration protein RuvA [Actinomycetales bacterium]
MIAILTGTVLDTRLDSVVLSVGGVGYLVMAAPDLIAEAKVGSQLSLHTSLVVREESLTLFGFTSNESRELFELIQGVSGFGPRLAFTILSFLTPEQLRLAIATGDTATLTKTPGVGAKGASRLVLELKDRIGESAATPAPQIWESQVEQALAGLGWSGKDAARAIAAIRGSGAPEAAPISEYLKQALQYLGRS